MRPTDTFIGRQANNQTRYLQSTSLPQLWEYPVHSQLKGLWNCRCTGVWGYHSFPEEKEALCGCRSPCTLWGMILSLLWACDVPPIYGWSQKGFAYQPHLCPSYPFHYVLLSVINSERSVLTVFRLFSEYLLIQI